jgi:hypothetical protein
MSRVRVALYAGILFAACTGYLNDGAAGAFVALSCGSFLLAFLETIAASAIAGDRRRRELEGGNDDDE